MIVMSITTTNIIISISIYYYLLESGARRAAPCGAGRVGVLFALRAPGSPPAAFWRTRGLVEVGAKDCTPCSTGGIARLTLLV